MVLQKNRGIMIKNYDELFKLDAFKNIQATLRHSDENNIFKILKLQNYEIRHSNYLAWLLDPKMSHGLEYSFLKNLLDKIKSGIKIDKETTFEVYTEYPISKINEHEKKGRIDIFIESKDFVCVIENKYGSKEHDKQCKRYRKFVKDKYKNIIKDDNLIFIYLDIYPPDEDLFNHGQALEGYEPITYEELLKILPEDLYDNIQPEDIDKIANNANFHQYKDILSSNYKDLNDKSALAEKIKIFLNQDSILNIILKEYKENKNKIEECNTVWTIQSYLWATALKRANILIKDIYDSIGLEPNEYIKWKYRDGNYGVYRGIPKGFNKKNENNYLNIFISIINNLKYAENFKEGINIKINVVSQNKETKQYDWKTKFQINLIEKEAYFKHILMYDDDKELLHEFIEKINKEDIIQKYKDIVNKYGI